MVLKDNIESYKKFMDSWFETVFYYAYGDVTDDKDVKNISRQFDCAVKVHSFFKNRDRYELEKFSNAVKNLNIIAIKTSGIICVEVDLLGDTVRILISSDNLTINGELLGLFKQSIEIFSEIYFNNNCLILRCVFK